MAGFNERFLEKPIFERIIEIMAERNIENRRKYVDRRKSSFGYTGPERRSGHDRRQVNVD